MPDLLKTSNNDTIKNKAIHLINKLPDQATWDDIMYEIYVKQKIDEGLKAAEEGRTLTHEEVKKQFNSK